MLLIWVICFEIKILWNAQKMHKTYHTILVSRGTFPACSKRGWERVSLKLPKFIYEMLLLKGVLHILVFYFEFTNPLILSPVPRDSVGSFFFFFPFFHEDNILNMKNFYFRTVRQVAQEQFFLMCTRCCMGHRPLLFFITLLFTVLGVRHFKNMLIIVIHSYTRNS